MAELKKQIKKEIHEFRVSPFNRHIALQKLENNLLALVDEHEQSESPKTELLGLWQKLREQIKKLPQRATMKEKDDVLTRWIERDAVWGLLEPFGSALQTLENLDFHEWIQENQEDLPLGYSKADLLKLFVKKMLG